jgi:hypothetical protein
MTFGSTAEKFEPLKNEPSSAPEENGFEGKELTDQELMASLPKYGNEELFQADCLKEAEALFSGRKNWYLYEGDRGDVLLVPMDLKQLDFSKFSRQINDHDPRPKKISEREAESYLLPDKRHLLSNEAEVTQIMEALIHLQKQEE